MRKTLVPTRTGNHLSGLPNLNKINEHLPKMSNVVQDAIDSRVEGLLSMRMLRGHLAETQQHLWGKKTTAAKRAKGVAPLFHQHLQTLMNKVIPHLPTEEMHKGYSQKVEISEGAKKELTWWSQ